jgi:hypothetical protein
MSDNKTMIKPTLNKVTKKSFKEAIYFAYKGGITTVAPLGFSGDTIILYAKEGKGRVSQVSIRNYCCDAELLITDINGDFLFYGRFHLSIGLDFMVNQYWQIFKSVKHLIETEVKKRPDFANLEIPKTAGMSIGFDMLRAYQKTCLHF